MDDYWDEYAELPSAEELLPTNAQRGYQTYTSTPVYTVAPTRPLAIAETQTEYFVPAATSAPLTYSSVLPATYSTSSYPVVVNPPAYTPTYTPTYSPTYSVATAPTTVPLAAPTYTPTYSVASTPTYSVASTPTYSVASTPTYSVASTPTYSVASTPTYSVASTPTSPPIYAVALPNSATSVAPATSYAPAMSSMATPLAWAASPTFANAAPTRPLQSSPLVYTPTTRTTVTTSMAPAAWNPKYQVEEIFRL